jgi:hypothetical protein
MPNTLAQSEETAEVGSNGTAIGGAMSPVTLELDFASETAARGYVLALASLLFGTAQSCTAMDDGGHGRDDLDLREIGGRVRTRPTTAIRIEIAIEADLQIILVTLRNGDSHVVQVQGVFSLEHNATGVLWLQSDPEFPGPLPVLALPIQGSAFSFDALHPLVALGAKLGDLREARLHINGDAGPTCVWFVNGQQEGAVPVVGSHDGAIWFAKDGVHSQGEPVAWWLMSAVAPPIASVPDDWWPRFDGLVTAEPRSPAEIEDHLRLLLPSVCRWRLGDLASGRQADFAVPAEDGMVSAIIPASDELIVTVDLHASTDVLQPALLHALAHVALRHVLPNDNWGHWDTAQTVTAREPHRDWDREARDYVLMHWARPGLRRVQSIDECTPIEKAQLGVWRVIDEMLGESRRLHAAAERYQKAAYQRQAAQRIVGMLEDYGGAMLCDGVGLGKTYVATTLMVHYANSWRDQRSAEPDRLLEPFRVTVLAPNSVVSTWRREALPGLAAFGVPLANVRVVSHTKLSRMTRASELLEPVRGGLSDLEHLLLSDLVIVDEAHNFRSLAARRTKVLRDLLRLQPRREVRRRVTLLTATPVNNSLEDLRQELSLLFARPLWMSQAKTDDGYRRQVVKDIRDRCTKARSARSRGDVAALVIHGDAEEKFKEAIEFRDDLDFGPNVQRIGDYLKEQDKKLKELQDRIRAEAQSGAKPAGAGAPGRIGEELLDRIVVQRSRALCKEIERQHASNVQLLFRADAGAPEKLHYADEYDGIEDVLARFLPLFDMDTGKGATRGPSRLSLKVYMWYDVREGLKGPDEESSVVGLQRVLVLKRLESSPVSFLITLLRLAVLHAHRLQQLGNLCIETGDSDRHQMLQAEIKAVLAQQSSSSLEKIRSLATGEPGADARRDFVQSLSAAYAGNQPAADTDDPPPQLSLFEQGGEEQASDLREELDRLWGLREAIISDFKTLLAVTPGLADIVFGKFVRAEWPRRFIAGGDGIDWPRSAGWGLRIVTDPKIRQLVGRLVVARRARQKAIAFSQFSDTIAYLRSVLAATEAFQRAEWQLVVRGLGIEGITKDEIADLRGATVAITGNTDDRDDVVNAFAPFYRIGPWRPATEEATDWERRILLQSWETSWIGAIVRPVDILLSTDVLAEGVNLQDAALLVNYDVHWNPVRMIQRSGRIDRRLNPRVEQFREFPDIESVAVRAGGSVPRYYWHEHQSEAPVTVNMILPDELEAELLLRERIATKTLAIDFTLGLEQGTGAEADWMANYKYHGITSLNSLQKDRAIEQVASHHERLSRVFNARGLRTEWAHDLNGWFRASNADDGSPLIGRALLGRRGGELERFTRYLEPRVVDGVPYWFWAEKRPGESMFDGWLVLDGRPEHFPPHPRRDFPWHDQVSTPLKASHILGACEFLEQEAVVLELSARDIGRPLMQGCSALAAPKLGSEEDRGLIAVRDFFLLQLPSFEPDLSHFTSSPTRRPDDLASHAE